MFSPKPLSVLFIAMVWQVSSVLLDAYVLGLGMIIRKDVGDASPERSKGCCVIEDMSIKTGGFEAKCCCGLHYCSLVSKYNYRSRTIGLVRDSQVVDQ